MRFKIHRRRLALDEALEVSAAWMAVNHRSPPQGCAGRERGLRTAFAGAFGLKAPSAAPARSGECPGYRKRVETPPARASSIARGPYLRASISRGPPIAPR